MHLSRTNLADIIYFLAIARHQSFRKAGLEVGISASALSHAMRGLETRLGVRLLNRTTRSVTLTAAGEELQELISSPVNAIGQALETLNRLRDEPAGRIRLNVLSDGAKLLLGPVLPVFVERYPDIQVDLTVTNKMVDIIGDGHDAGIRFGGTVPEDMIAQRLSPDVAWAVVGAPGYLEQFGTPTHPKDLHGHRCLRIRLGNSRLYHWQFAKDGQQIEIDAPGAITLDETRVGVALATRGAGLMYVPASIVERHVKQGLLKRVLEDWTHYDPGFHIYYSSSRQVPVGLRLLIELIRELEPMGPFP
ncbi:MULTISPECIES: LysR family transcriptional regulator [Pseudomonas fluorescens group]|uniref:DmlR_12 protein n=1 Tax=Pseudomonas fluorescens TaxID=294 RepID=A0A0D0TDJ6_PSEFL|nr:MULTISPECIES: LysR family transcriptional regulator [Pseudomonas fluorescens group]AZE61087.1 Transcriptional regulator, LysR family [Pseudomonas synxantha]KIR21546.1 HTH-type transcriptional regulator DmlR [Pseudomonas fluorescens]